MAKRVAGIVLIIVGIVFSVWWVFQEGPHYETAEGSAALSADFLERGKILWEPEGGFVGHAVAAQLIALALGAMGIVLINKGPGDE